MKRHIFEKEVNSIVGIKIKTDEALPIIEDAGISPKPTTVL